MVLEKIRHLTNKIIFPIAQKFENSRISPNIITVLGFFVMIVTSVYTALVGLLGWQPIFLLGSLLLVGLSGFLDMLDGGVAKVTGQKTKFGGVLDSTMDRYSDGVLIAGLVCGNFLNPPFLNSAGNPLFWGVLLGFFGLMGAYLTSYIRSRAEIEGVTMAGVGTIERAERLVGLVLGLVLEIVLPAIGMMFYVFLILAILMNITAIQRLHHAFKFLTHVDQDMDPST